MQSEAYEFRYDEDLFERIQKDGIQEFTLLELEFIDLAFKITNAPIFIEDRDERYEYLIRQLTNINKLISDNIFYLSKRELYYAKAVSVLVKSQLTFINEDFNLSYGLPNDIEGFGEMFMSK